MMNSNKWQHYPRLSSEAIAEIAWESMRSALFLAAWKKEIKLADKSYFKISGKVEDATDKWNLQPRYHRALFV